MYLRLSKAVSVVLHPFLVPLYMVSLLLLAGTVYSLYPLKVKIYLIWVTLLFTTIIPVLVIALLKSYRKIGDADLSDRKERFIPLLAMIACYTLCAVAIARIPSAQMLSRFMFAGACCVAVCLFVRLLLEDQPAYDGVGCCRGFYRSDQYRQRQGTLRCVYRSPARCRCARLRPAETGVSYAVASGGGIRNWFYRRRRRRFVQLVISMKNKAVCLYDTLLFYYRDAAKSFTIVNSCRSYPQMPCLASILTFLIQGLCLKFSFRHSPVLILRVAIFSTVRPA